MPFFLAEKNESSPLVFLIFVAIWVIFSIISAIAKKQEEAKRKRVREQLEMGMPTHTQPAPPQPQQPMPQMFQPRMQRPERVAQKPVRPSRVQQRVPVERQRQRAQNRSGPRQAPRQAPPPPPIPTHSVVETIPRMTQMAQMAQAGHDVFATEVGGKPSKQAKTNVNANALNLWMRPETLRRQFILTEILQPPLALRPDHLH